MLLAAELGALRSSAIVAASDPGRRLDEGCWLQNWRSSCLPCASTSRQGGSSSCPTCGAIFVSACLLSARSGWWL